MISKAMEHLHVVLLDKSSCQSCCVQSGVVVMKFIIAVPHNEEYERPENFVSVVKFP